LKIKNTFLLKKKKKRKKERKSSSSTISKLVLQMSECFYGELLLLFIHALLLSASEMTW